MPNEGDEKKRAPQQTRTNRLPQDEANERGGGQNVAESVKQVGQAAVERVSEFTDRAAQSYEQGRERITHWVDEVSERATEEPIKTLLIAAGIGVVVGVLFG